MDLSAALKSALRGGAKSIGTHLLCSERDIQIGETQAKIHCYHLPVDANGRVRFKPLAEFLRDQIIDYAIPRKVIEEALRQSKETNSTAPLARLDRRAQSLFTNLATTGEGGELLVFAMAEAVFGLTQVICKMALKTSTSMHYHGSDGVYAEGRPDGGMNLYWGESKVHKKPDRAIRSCFKSLAPFLREPDGADAAREQDLFLINEFANFTDPRLIVALQTMLDRNHPESLTLRHCGFALCAFDCSAYPSSDGTSTVEAIVAAVKKEQTNWAGTATLCIKAEKLANFDMHVICVPMPSAEDFRAYFLELLRGSS